MTPGKEERYFCLKLRRKEDGFEEECGLENWRRSGFFFLVEGNCEKKRIEY